MTLPILAKKVKRIASMQLFNIKLLINGRGLYKFKKEYQLGKEMGQGGFGVVYRAVRIVDGLPVAVKFIERRHVREWGRLNDERLPMEICMLARCAKIPGVVRLIDWFSVPEGFFIVMERPSACVDLFDFIHSHGCLTEDLTRFLFRQIVKSTIDCMKRKVLHRDIKDENIVINLANGEIRIVDFGAATLLKKSRYQDFQGTRLYCPPEWFLHSIYLGAEATVWSLGVLLYNMLNGKLPFHNEKDICTAHLLGPLPFFAKLSPGARSLIEKCLQFDPRHRPSLEAILEDKWLSAASAAEWLSLSASTINKSGEKKLAVPTAKNEEDDTVIVAPFCQISSSGEAKTTITAGCKYRISAFEMDAVNLNKTLIDNNNNNNDNNNNNIINQDLNNNNVGRAESGVASLEFHDTLLSNQGTCLFADAAAVDKTVSAADVCESIKPAAPRRNAKTSLLTSMPPQSDALIYNDDDTMAENDRYKEINNKDASRQSRRIRRLHNNENEMAESFDSGVSAALTSPTFLF